MKIVATRRAEQNHAPIDPWTLVHLSAGLALGLMNVPRRWAVIGALAYEVIEQVAERDDWGKQLFETRGPESPINAVVDTVVFVAGHVLGTRWLDT
jgi:hypothetical protein